MSVGLLALILIAATGFASAGFDLYQKILARWLQPVPMVFWLGLISTPLFVVGVLFDGVPEISSGYWWPALISVVLNLGGHIAFVRAVKVSDLSMTVPLLSFTPVFTAAIGWVLLDENPSWMGGLGILLVVGGALWLHAAPGRAWLQMIQAPGAGLMLATALAWSIAIPLDKIAVAASGALFHGMILTFGITLGAALLLRGEPWKPDLSGVRVREFLVGMALCVATLLFQLLALTVTLASFVETGKRGLANLLAIAFGRLVFGELIDSRKVLAVCLMAIGVAMILLSMA